MQFRSQTWNDLNRLFNELPPDRIRLLFVVLAASFAQGLIDMALVAIMTRLAGLVSGGQINDLIPGVHVFENGILNQSGWLLFLLVVGFWVASLVRFGVVIIQSKLGAEIWNDLVNKVYRNLLLQRYEFFEDNRTANLSDSFNRILNRVTNSVIAPLLSIAGNALSVIVLLVGVVFVIGWSAFIMFGLMLMSFVLVSAIITPYIRMAAKQRVRFSRRINLVVMESMRSMRDVQLYSAEDYFVNRLSRDGVVANRNERLEKMLPDVPRLFVEPVAITIIFLVGLAPVALSGDFESFKDSVPAVVGIMLTLTRISGPLQNSFRSLNKLRGGLPDIQGVLKLLELPHQRHLLSGAYVPSASGVMPKQTIQMQNVSFRYDIDSSDILQDINLTVPVGSRVALVGRTGSGKSTVAHLLLGLFKPSTGELRLDGLPLEEIELPAWQANCALVPQDIRLLDGSIRENVAFGVEPEDINDDRVWSAIESAQFDAAVAEMAYGLYTIIGEDGIKLSGGQRQRLSLARAFYRGAKVLVLDEATSALDNKTESDVMQALELVGRRCTMILIAHRLSTVRRCDQIFEIEAGKIKAYGTFDELCESSQSFRELNQIDRS